MAHVKIKNMISTSDPRVCMIGHPAPAWMVNYADLMTELVCFFIVLYALSASLNKGVQEAKKEVEEQMKQEQVKGDVKVDKDGMHITIQEQGDNVFFASGSADLSPRMVEILATISPALLKLAKDQHDIVVEGHTDNVPIRTAKFSSNWELSTARATSVVQHLIKVGKFPPDRMGAIGYGQFRPLAPNDSEEHRSSNRRVVFFVKNAPPVVKEEGKKKKEEKVEPAAPAEEASGEEAANADAQAPPEDENTAAYPKDVQAGEVTVNSENN